MSIIPVQLSTRDAYDENGGESIFGIFQKDANGDYKLTKATPDQFEQVINRQFKLYDETLTEVVAEGKDGDFTALGQQSVKKLESFASGTTYILVAQLSDDGSDVFGSYSMGDIIIKRSSAVGSAMKISYRAVSQYASSPRPVGSAMTFSSKSNAISNADTAIMGVVDIGTSKYIAIKYDSEYIGERNDSYFHGLSNTDVKVVDSVDSWTEGLFYEDEWKFDGKEVATETYMVRVGGTDGLLDYPTSIDGLTFSKNSGDGDYRITATGVTIESVVVSAEETDGSSATASILPGTGFFEVYTWNGGIQSDRTWTATIKLTR